MPNYKQRDLRDTQTTTPPLDPLAGGRIAKRDRVLSMYTQADRLLGNGRRVLGRVGLHGSERFQVKSISPESTGQVYPTIAAVRKAARLPPINLTPGHMLRFSALVCPSGMTNKAGGGLGWTADSPFGQINVRVTFIGGATDTVVFSTGALPVSGELYAGEGSDEGWCWASLQRVEITIIYPDNVLAAIADKRHYSDGVTAEVSIEYQGSPRVVDAVVEEVPYFYVRDVGTDTAYACTLATDATGKPVLNYPVEFPIEERGPIDPTYGSLLLADVVNRHHTELGPILAYWSSWDEKTQDVAATEATTITTTSTSFVALPLTSLTDWSSSYPGWSLSSGATAQSWRTSNALRETRNKNAAVPVRVWVLGYTTASTATVRFQSERYSIADVEITGTTPEWYSAVGHLRCGIGVEDESVLMVLGKVSGGTATLHVRALCVEWLTDV